MWKRNGTFYSEDRETGQQLSLRTNSRDEGLRLITAKNEAAAYPVLNIHLARTYLSAADPATLQRNWSDVFEEIIKTKTGSTKERWQRAAKDPAFKHLKNQKLFETRAEHFLTALEKGTVATNVFLRRIHNFALGMNWLLSPVLPKKPWPLVRYGEKRAITWDEHLRIIDREGNREKKAFYELLWHLGGSQGDVASLKAEDINWKERVISFRRMKLKKRENSPVVISFGSNAEHVLKGLPQSGPLFPYLLNLRASDRATEFKQRCKGLGIDGVTLHSYRYAWAERAKSVGMPERFAMEALGHNSKAVHRVYSKNALVKVPSLEDLERNAESKIFPMNAKVA